MKICACCGTKLESGMTTGYSGLYNPSGDTELCEPCFFLEDTLIEEIGGNNIPNALEAYRIMIGESSSVLMSSGKTAAMAVRMGQFTNIFVALRSVGELNLAHPFRSLEKAS